MIDIIADYALPFLVILTVLVFVHEWGHYFVARRNGVRVEAFAIGFGPELFGWNAKSGTRWKVCAIPLGGYVKMFGDADPASAGAADDSGFTEEDRRESFHHKSLGARAAVVAAGPAANFIFAILVLAGLYMFEGRPYAPAVVDKVIENSAAERAGLMVEDRVVSADGTEVSQFSDLSRIVFERPGEPILLVIERDGATREITVTPDPITETDRFGNEISFGRLGIQSNQTTVEKLDPLNAVMVATTETFSIIEQTLDAVGEMIIGVRGTEELGGPLRIAEMSGTVAQSGLVMTLWFTAVLSINLGLINLFPVPILDGGHLMFYALEAVRGRPLGERAQEWASIAGLSLVVMLMLFVTWNDLMRFDIVGYLGSLVG
ncbi:RIP metalloprotease RseP [Thalassobaculum salexigens]|uniref:RIP metalloprotease RseP n=1 Tax=Thalassobaculum salexigens TaxID=455360 RepID=UPI0004164454|nr:RIP metalloprotease RseP [Thalassobaculum salexigens]